jgi:hypothetical protein
MIYLSPLADAPIQQGDIFKGIPRVDITLDSLSLIEEGEQLETTWQDVISGDEMTQPVTAVLPIRPVLAIVITQNCDAVRSAVLSLCEIGDYLTEAEKASPPKDPKAWSRKIIRSMMERPSIFYLPEDAAFGIQGRKAVDFRSILRVLRVDLEAMRNNRIARLNDVAYEHFRESLAQFFRRYPVNAWYPLTKEEFDAYADSQKEEKVEPYVWQRL